MSSNRQMYLIEAERKVRRLHKKSEDLKALKSRQATLTESIESFKQELQHNDKWMSADNFWAARRLAVSYQVSITGDQICHQGWSQ